MLHVVPGLLAQCLYNPTYYVLISFTVSTGFSDNLLQFHLQFPQDSAMTLIKPAKSSSRTF